MLTFFTSKEIIVIYYFLQ